MVNIIGMGTFSKNWNDGSGDKLYMSWTDGETTVPVVVSSDANNTGTERYVDILVATTAGTPQCNATIRVIQAPMAAVRLLLGVKVNGEFCVLGKDSNNILGKE